jgi:Ca2+-binding RTX toxin-like protein
MTVDLSKGTVSGYGESTEEGIENLVGSSHDDWLKGDKGDNVINGGAGADWLRGYEGSDVLDGGADADTFFWYDRDVRSDGGDHWVDTIKNFEADDVLDFSGIVSQTGATASEWIELNEVGGDTYISVRLSAAESAMTDVVVLEGVTGLNVNDMIADGSMLM